MRNLLSSVKKKTIENRNKTSRNCISITKELARLVEEEEEEEEVNEEGFNIKSSAPSHTHGVQPLGNLYLNTGSTNSRDTGLGNLHTLSDDLVLDIHNLFSEPHELRLRSCVLHLRVWSHA